MRIAIQGCCHGELNKIYDTIEHINRIEEKKIELLIICGDFQSVRDSHDLNCLTCPPKYRALHDFHEYYTGAKKAPVLTIFIGGNHEAMNVLRELYFGGYVAPNIFFMGYSSVISIGGLLIGGISGIYNKYSYAKPHLESFMDLSRSPVSAYHYRECELQKLQSFSQKLDIMISHDWPLYMYNYGNKQQLLYEKRFFQDDIAKDELGSLPLWNYLLAKKPEHWFSGHLHCKFAAMVPHDDGKGAYEYTKFLALDKVIPGRKFLQVMDFDGRKFDDEIKVPAEWLSIQKGYLKNFPYKKRWDGFISGSGNTSQEDVVWPMVVPDSFNDMAYRQMIVMQREWFETLVGMQLPSDFVGIHGGCSIQLLRVENGDTQDKNETLPIKPDHMCIPPAKDLNEIDIEFDF